jgi:hypothetical protein
MPGASKWLGQGADAAGRAVAAEATEGVAASATGTATAASADAAAEMSFT